MIEDCKDCKRLYKKIINAKHELFYSCELRDIPKDETIVDYLVNYNASKIKHLSTEEKKLYILLIELWSLIPLSYKEVKEVFDKVLIDIEHYYQ